MSDPKSNDAATAGGQRSTDAIASTAGAALLVALAASEGKEEKRPDVPQSEAKTSPGAANRNTTHTSAKRRRHAIAGAAVLLRPGRAKRVRRSEPGPLRLVERTATELKRHPNGPQALLKHAEALWKIDRHLEALLFVERSLDRRPHAAAYLVRAHILYHLKRYADALTNYADAIRLQGDIPAAHRWRATCLHQLGRNDEALVAMDAALAIRPVDAEALVARSDILRALDRHDDAAAACRLSLEFEPDRPESVLALAVALHAAGRWEAALVECHRAVKLEPTSTEAHAQRIAAFVALKRFDDAIASVRPLTHGPAPRAEHVLLLAQTLAGADRRGEALENVEIAIALDPLEADAHIMRASILNGIGANGAPPEADHKSLGQAVRSYEHAIAVERDPKAMVWIRSCRAATLYALARDDEAFVDIVAAEGRPGATAALPALKSAVLFRLGRHADALAVADTELASTSTASEQALQIRVLALAKLGRLEEARADAARYFILFGDDDEVRGVAEHLPAPRAVAPSS
jgi:tetratricopeptide (TPR) repeat protein